jgi:hypothetical protein
MPVSISMPTAASAIPGGISGRGPTRGSSFAVEVVAATITAPIIVRARSQIKPRVEELVARAQEQGALRRDLQATDLPLILMMLDTVVDTTRDVSPDSWRRALEIVLDGLAARRDGPSPLPAPGLDEEQLDAAIAAWRP